MWTELEPMPSTRPQPGGSLGLVDVLALFGGPFLEDTETYVFLACFPCCDALGFATFFFFTFAPAGLGLGVLGAMVNNKLVLEGRDRAGAARYDEQNFLTIDFLGKSNN